MALLALSTGLRRGEMFGLQWKHINLETKTVKVEQASQYIPKIGTFLKEPKNEGSKRIITISDNIASLLKQHKAKQLAKRLKLGGTEKTGGKWKGAEEPENDFVFTTWNGEPAQPDSINKWLNKFVKANELPHLTPHGFRHMAATYLITAGVDLRTVAGKLGHANSATTQLVYSHLLKSAEEETANKLETFIQQATEKAKENQKKQAK
jgi:integrase